MRYEIRLTNCAFHARHGVLPEEAELGQRFYVDAELLVGSRTALRSDAVEDTVHYGEVFQTVERIVTGTRRKLIEALAHDVTTALLKQFALVEEVEIVVRKPSVPIDGILDHAEVRVRTRRGG